MNRNARTFSRIGTDVVNNVARWDGNQWHALGSGVYNGGPAQAVSAVAILGNDVYNNLKLLINTDGDFDIDPDVGPPPRYLGQF